MNLTEILAVILGGGLTAAIVSGVIQLILWKLNRKAVKEDKSESSDTHVKDALRIILHDRIKYLGKKHITEGYISAEDLRDLMDMHKIYHDPKGLNGNGFLDNIMNQVKALPIRK